MWLVQSEFLFSLRRDHLVCGHKPHIEMTLPVAWTSIFGSSIKIDVKLLFGGGSMSKEHSSGLYTNVRSRSSTTREPARREETPHGERDPVTVRSGRPQRNL
jgi:hypothetical protein